jgi:hypothetical protein
MDRMFSVSSQSARERADGGRFAQAQKTLGET